MKPLPTTYLTPAEVAQRLGVSPITVRSWATKGWLPSQVTPGGHRRYRLDDVDRLSQQRNADAIPELEPARVLVVDDDPKFRSFLLEALRVLAPDLQVREAADGFQAGMAMAEFAPALVLLDYSMPGMNGVEVCRMIKSNSGHAPTRVVAITGLADAEVAQSLRDAGADDLLFKPVSLQRLRELIDDFGLGLENGAAAELT